MNTYIIPVLFDSVTMQTLTSVALEYLAAHKCVKINHLATPVAASLAITCLMMTTPACQVGAVCNAIITWMTMMMTKLVLSV